MFRSHIFEIRKTIFYGTVDFDKHSR